MNEEKIGSDPKNVRPAYQTTLYTYQIDYIANDAFQHR